MLREHWGRGAGTAIMDRLVQETKRLGGRKIVLDFNADNTRAEKLYERMGFYVEGRLREQIMVDGRYVDLVCMAKFLI